MTRSIVTGLLGLISVVAVGILPIACQSGGVGDPCIPEDEYNPQFAGFKVTEENIESRSFQCQTRIRLVNHFQGRVSCPLGQAPPTPCNPANNGSECNGAKCIEAGTFTTDCDPDAADGGAAACAGLGGACIPERRQCGCTQTANCPAGSFCDATAKECKSYVCHTPGNCQIGDGSPDDNANKACCVPGTDTPVAAPVCGQCNNDSKRDAEKAVYCSCRCGVAEGEPEDENFNFCECPSGFECKEIRKNVGLGDKQITGKYCIKLESEFKSEQECGQVSGYFNSQQCKGIGL